MAFITILSVFNGFDLVVRGLFNSFYADIEIVPKEGKVFTLDEETLIKLQDLDQVMEVSSMVEENALLVYGDRQTISTVRGVSPNYHLATGIDTMIGDGEYKLYNQSTPQAVIGRGIKYMLNIEPEFADVLKIIVPHRTAKIHLDPNRALNTKRIRPAGYFISQPEIEVKYIIVPLDFAQSLFDYNQEISALEIKLDPQYNESRAQKNIEEIVGNQFKVKNRVQQNELLYKTMQSEKWAIFFILAFILLVASFNVVGTLTMLIIEKKNDIQTLRNLGTKLKTIKRTFLLEGLIVSFLGALTGLLIGSIICLIQQEFGVVKLQGAESFVIDAYPVRIMFTDIIIVLVIVSGIGYFASWYPIRFITRKYLSD